LAIQSEKDGQFVVRIQYKTAAKDIPEWFHFRSNGSFRQFKVMGLSGKPASIMDKKKNSNCIRI
jgi:hypothetical protein